MNPPQQPATTPAPADPRQQVLEHVKSGTNVLVTVSENPSVDQLAAAIGMTLLLNKLGKHATAVFSGQIPSTIQFLQPEKTLEKNTDSLRDFIIALDKSKADKLRYKIEDKFVKIFITPYHTSLSDKDLEFSQGEFNVDVVLALGVKKRDDLDKALVEHGRIFHDATVICVNDLAGADLGSINWVQESASGLSEMMVGLAEDLKTEQQPKLVDQQIATCLLTGIVAQTDRFSNAKTSPQTMALAAKLMNAGANQQLIATKLQPPEPDPKPQEKEINTEPPKPTGPPAPATPEAPKVIVQPPVGQPKPPKPPKPVVKPEPKPEPEPEKPKETQDGALLVPHDGITGEGVAYSNEPDENIAKIHIDTEGVLKRVADEDSSAPTSKKAEPAEPATQPASESNPDNRKILDQPPTLGGDMSASTQPQGQEGGSDPLTLPSVKGPTLNHGQPSTQSTAGLPAETPKVENDNTLSDIEKAVNSPHLREVDEHPAIDPNGLPRSIVGEDKGLPAEQTAGTAYPAPPPPVPPPITITPPPPGMSPDNLSNPNSGAPL